MRTCICFYLNCKLDAIRNEVVHDEAFSEWKEMFALNDSTPYGNEICGSHRSARPISKVSARVFVATPSFLGQGKKILCMYEGERKRAEYIFCAFKHELKARDYCQN